MLTTKEFLIFQNINFYELFPPRQILLPTWAPPFPECLTSKQEHSFLGTSG